MKRAAAVSLLAVALLLGLAATGEAHGRRFHGHRHGHFHSRVFIGIGPTFAAYPYWWYYPSPVYVYSPPVVIQQPPVYIQQQPAQAAPAPAPQAFWYYCPSAKAYYPEAATCPEPWVKVAPRAE